MDNTNHTCTLRVTPLVIEEAVIPVVVPPTSADKGKGIQEELVRTRAQPLVIPETSKKRNGGDSENNQEERL